MPPQRTRSNEAGNGLGWITDRSYCRLTHHIPQEIAEASRRVIKSLADIPEVVWSSEVAVSHLTGKRRFTETSNTITGEPRRFRLPANHRAVWGYARPFSRCLPRIREIVEDAFSLELAARVVHVMTLEGMPTWGRDQVTKALSPESLTMAVLGFTSVEQTISTRIGGALRESKRVLFTIEVCPGHFAGRIPMRVRADGVHVVSLAPQRPTGDPPAAAKKSQLDAPRRGLQSGEPSSDHRLGVAVTPATMRQDLRGESASAHHRPPPATKACVASARGRSGAVDTEKPDDDATRRRGAAAG